MPDDRVRERRVRNRRTYPSDLSHGTHRAEDYDYDEEGIDNNRRNEGPWDNRRQRTGIKADREAKVKPLGKPVSFLPAYKPDVDTSTSSAGLQSAINEASRQRIERERNIESFIRRNYTERRQTENPNAIPEGIYRRYLDIPGRSGGGRRRDHGALIRPNSKPMNLGQRLATKAGKIGMGASLAASFYKAFEAGKQAYDKKK